jgi:hypothetical protein
MCLAHAHVVERSLVDPHREWLPPAGLGAEHLESGVALGLPHLRRREVGDRLHLLAEQRVDARRVVRKVDDHDLIDVRLALPPVVRVLDEHAALARREALVLERTGAHRVLRVVVRGHNAVEVLPDVVREADVRDPKPDAHRAGIELFGGPWSM